MVIYLRRFTWIFPLGYEEREESLDHNQKYVCKLHKSIYGLKKCLDSGTPSSLLLYYNLDLFSPNSIIHQTIWLFFCGLTCLC